jgi:pilus assembly protein FimV
MGLDQASIKKEKKSKKAVAQTVATQDKDADTVATQELTTKRGDTLSSVAKELQVEGVSLDQMLVGLYESNQQAFLSGNINRLKVGQIIKAPTKESLLSISSQEASKSVRLHASNWNAYRNNLAGAVPAATVMVEAEQKQSASGKIATAEDKAAPVKVGPQDVVKLSAGEKDVSKAYDAKIVALQEETASREKSLKEAESRATALEKQIQDMQKLLAMKNQSMADVQNNAVVAAPAPVKEVPKAEVAVTSEAKPVEVKPADSVAVSKPVVKKALPVRKLTPPVESKAEVGFFESLMSLADLAILGGASGVALLGAGWMFLRNKRKKGLDSFERGILTSGGLRANTVFGNTTGDGSASDTSFLTDFAQRTDISMIDTNDVDPIAEAEVYMAYGRDVQAEEILKDAILKEPQRYELHLKLLEMYAMRKDTSAFETIAGELYITLGAADPTWAKVADLGAGMEPENPLYDVSKIVAATSLETQKLDASDFSDVAVSTGADLDFLLDDDMEVGNLPELEDAKSVVMQSFAAAKNIEQKDSFDPEEIEIAPVENGSVEAVTQVGLNESQVATEPAVDNSMDFDLGDFNIETPVAFLDTVSTSGLPTFDTTMVIDEKPQEAHFDLPDPTESLLGKSTSLDMNFDVPELDSEATLEKKSDFDANSTDEISFDMGFTVDASSESPSAVESISPADLSASASEIFFDLPSIEEPVISNAEVRLDSNEFGANTLDLSSISFDLGGAESELTLASPAAPVVNDMDLADISSESPDVNIKLDLVAAYIDMEDRDGARELLEEVLKEGGVQQKLRAQHLLDNMA